MGLFSKLFKGPEPDMEKSNANAKKMRQLFNLAVENGDDYKIIFGYTEDVSRFNYGFVHGSKTKIGNLIVGWDDKSQTIIVVPTVPDLSGCGDPAYYIGINAYDWLDDESLYVYVSQEEELKEFTEFFMSSFAKK